MRQRRTLGWIVLLLLAVTIPHAIAAKPVDAATEVISIARDQLSKDFRMGAEGPDRFDCSGLVYYAFTKAGLYEGMFGARRFLARDYYAWGLQHDALSTTNPEVGDLILWTHPGSDKIVHMGIYVGTDDEGKPLALSALTIGVRVHRLDTIVVKFLTYVHTGLSQANRDNRHDDGQTTGTRVKGTPPPTRTQPGQGFLYIVGAGAAKAGAARSGGVGSH
jgi:hypothetical protein